MILYRDYFEMKRILAPLFNTVEEDLYLDGTDVVRTSDEEGKTIARLDVVGTGKVRVSFILNYNEDPNRPAVVIDVPGADYEAHEGPRRH
jgi:hypothetical protein